MIDSAISYLKKRVDSYEIFYQDLDVLSVSLQGNVPDNVTEGRTAGVGVRVEIKKKIGLASTLNLKNIKECCDAAIKFAKLNDPDPFFVKFPDPQKYVKLKQDKRLFNFGFEEAESYLKKCSGEIKEYKKLKLSLINYTRTHGSTRIVNSEGVDAEETSAVNSRFCEMVMGDISLGFGDEDIVPLKAIKMKEDALRLLQMEKRVQVKTGIMPILFHPEALSQIVAEALHFSFDAENVLLKKSFLGGKIGEQVFDKNISIIDDGLSPEKLHAKSFDDEGTPSQRTTLIEKGVLKGFLYDFYHALREKKKSTGNAIRSIASSPSITPSNFCIGSGKKLNLMKEMDSGLYIKGLMGLHTMNPSTGEFSLNVSEGQVIKNGEMGDGLKEVMIAGNIFELLKDVEIGKKVEYGGQGNYLPHILFPKVNVVGK
ncbi:MAG: TldD/PmbA family protein [Candidatus Nanoarchaeia archaeon]